ncbi:hypothetical protein R1sor_023375 [Riccia sorocarpa]|uniref:DDE Tnp4 domain-containing protein n=1 Tax=Riccia sorocarpa TaxID=122646 RepID=A0ABD3GTG9_9MARC
MVNYTNRVITALESAMGHEIAWPNRQERAVNSVHFAELGFPGCIGLVDGTLVKLSQRPRDDGETYFDRKSNYSMNVQVICDQHKRVIYFFAGMLGSCHDLTCLRRSSLWKPLGAGSAQFPVWSKWKFPWRLWKFPFFQKSSAFSVARY